MIGFSIFFFIFSAPSNLIPTSPSVDVQIISGDRILVSSKQIIESVSLSDLNEWCSYFICYSPDCRKVIILIRTTQTPLKITVETKGLGDFSVRKRHQLIIRNPWTFRYND